MNRNFWSVFLVILAFVQMACSPVSHSQFNSASHSKLVGGVQIPSPNNPLTTGITICSQLDLNNIQWPVEINSLNASSHFALALNITGSFEGRNGWKNIADNSDGQGLSLGLLQQNFGQGTLQPLLVKMFKYNNSIIKNIFTTADYNSVKQMLEEWLNETLTVASLSTQSATDELMLFPKKLALNKLDINIHEYGSPLMSVDESASVQWAVNTIYSNEEFIPRWKTSFENLAQTASYRSLQVEASTKMFLEAVEYAKYFKFRELPQLLFLFDIVVQNGGIGSDHLQIYNNWLAKNSAASEQSKAIALLNARLTTVNPVYVEDVRSRKTTIIKGIGTVHGNERNLTKEYCYNQKTLLNF